MTNRPAVLFYCQHSLGMGHLMRSFALADRLAERFRVVLLNGGRLPKGIAAPTLELVAEALRGAQEEQTAIDIARRTGISRGTARRYLEYLDGLGRVTLELRYGAAGRPEHRFRLTARS